jgi:hypothetical protein
MFHVFTSLDRTPKVNQMSNIHQYPTKSFGMCHKQPLNRCAASDAFGSIQNGFWRLYFFD